MKRVTSRLSSTQSEPVRGLQLGTVLPYEGKEKARFFTAVQELTGEGEVNFRGKVF
jgi:hypothetical protein